MIFPNAYQHVLDNVKPDRLQNNRAAYRQRWWQFGENVHAVRKAVKNIPKYAATVYTAKHRIFQFVSHPTIVDATINVIAIDDPWLLAALSSRSHTYWSSSAGGRLGVGNDLRYNKSRCFDPFPFPSPTDAQKTTLRALGEELDKHRKDRQAEHPKLTLTQMYNVLEKLRAGDTIEGKDREIYEQGLIGLLKDIHDRIDAAVAEAYGWPVDLGDAEILQRLVDLNAERAKEEAAGKIRWLRPDYQNPTGRDGIAKGETGEMDLGVKDSTVKPAWPKTMPEQVAAVRDALAELGHATPEQIARSFKRGRAANVLPLLESMAVMGSVSRSENNTYRPTR